MVRRSDFALQLAFKVLTVEPVCGVWSDILEQSGLVIAQSPAATANPVKLCRQRGSRFQEGDVVLSIDTIVWVVMRLLLAHDLCLQKCKIQALDRRENDNKSAPLYENRIVSCQATDRADYRSSDTHSDGDESAL